MEPLWFKLILPLAPRTEQASLFTSSHMWLTSNEVWRHKTNSNRTMVWTHPSSRLQHLQSQREAELAIHFLSLKLCFPSLRKTDDMRKYPWYNHAGAETDDTSALCAGAWCGHTHNYGKLKDLTTESETILWTCTSILWTAQAGPVVFATAYTLTSISTGSLQELYSCWSLR